jgi:Domain of unknown function (DUF4396)
MPHWLMVVSWLAIILGVLTAMVIAFDEVAHPQHMKIMNVVWPVTGLYVPVIGWWAYTGLGRRKSALAHSTPGKNEFWKSVLVSSTHCSSGCVIGDISFCGRMDAVRRATVRRLRRLVCSCLYFWDRVPISPIREVRMALIDALKADTLALTAFEVGLFAWMAVMYFLFVPRPEPTSAYYWFLMQIGMVLGFITTYPANWLLVKWGVKAGM